MIPHRRLGPSRAHFIVLLAPFASKKWLYSLFLASKEGPLFQSDRGPQHLHHKSGGRRPSCPPLFTDAHAESSTQILGKLMRNYALLALTRLKFPKIRNMRRITLRPNFPSLKEELFWKFHVSQNVHSCNNNDYFFNDYFLLKTNVKTSF